MQLTTPVKEIGVTVIFISVLALIVGSILSNNVFTEITIINVTTLTASFGGFVTGLIAFFAIAGTLIGILFLVKYVVKLFSKDAGLGAISA
jgi:hypothetical protein